MKWRAAQSTADASVKDASSTTDASKNDATAPTGPVVYVSAGSGDDVNEGLTPAHAKKTIAAGIQAAGAISGAEVHVCAGTYAEDTLNLSAAVSLKGAYDCANWTRTAGYGYPTFDKINETVVQSANFAGQAATLLVSGSVPKSVTIDGFTIEGAPTSAQADGQTVGIALQDSASPTLSNDDVTGGGGVQHSMVTGVAAGSIGLSVSGTASPEVTHDRIAGGTGSGVDYGSVGAFLTGTGAPSLHDLTVTGGNPTVAGSVGILATTSLTKAGGNPLLHDIVYGADLGATVRTQSDAIIVEMGASVDLVGSDVHGNDTAATDCQIAHGISDTSSGTVLLTGDRIFGGFCQATYGISLTGSGKLEADNCMVHGGDGIAIGVQQTSGTLLLSFDTIYEPGSYHIGLSLTGGTTTVRSVLLLGGLNNFGISACSITDIDHTVLANFGYAAQCPMTWTKPDLSMLGGSQSANTMLLNTTGTCNDCPSALFGASWGVDDGVTALFASSGGDGGTSQRGWTFSGSPPCSIATGGAPLANVTTDINGATRSTSTPSVGATEVVGPCM
jgi:hypothetical protein